MCILRVAQKTYPDVTGGGPYHVHVIHWDILFGGLSRSFSTVLDDKTPTYVNLYQYLLLSTRFVPEIFDPNSDVGERSHEHGRRVSIGGRIGNRVIRSGRWGWMKMRTSRVGIRMPIPPALPPLLGTMSFDVV